MKYTTRVRVMKVVTIVSLIYFAIAGVLRILINVVKHYELDALPFITIVLSLALIWFIARTSFTEPARRSTHE